MAGSNSVISVTITGDSTGLDKATTSASTSVAKMTTSAGKSTDNFATSFGKSSKTFRGAGDLFKVAGDAASAFGINLPVTELVGFTQMGSDLAKGFKEVLNPAFDAVKTKLGLSKTAIEEATVATEGQAAATDEAAGAQEGLNVAMDENPIGAVVLVVGLLVAAVYELWTHCTTFRDIVKSVFKDVQKAVTDVWNWIKDHWGLLLAILTGPFGLAVLAIKDHWKTIKDDVTGVVSWIGTKFSAVANAISGPFKSGANLIVDALNIIVDGLNDTVAGSHWWDVVGHIPSIPHLQTGGAAMAGQAYRVGEAGPELFIPSVSGRVVNANDTAAMGAGGSTTTFYSGATDITAFVTHTITTRDAKTKQAASAGSRLRTG